MNTSIACDVYGTLIDPLGVSKALEPLVGAENALSFSRTWRQKQLEYSFRRALMKQYEGFPVCIRQALDYSCAVHDCDLLPADREALMALYLELPVYEDVRAGLLGLEGLPLRLFAFSNGLQTDVCSLLERSGIIDFFEDIISVDEVRSFKPDPAVYDYFLRKTASAATSTWLVSSNPFDVLGAHAVGWQSAWVQRDTTNVFDPWQISPSRVITTLTGLADALQDPDNT